MIKNQENPKNLSKPGRVINGVMSGERGQRAGRGGPGNHHDTNHGLLISDCVFNEVDFSSTSFSECYSQNCTFQNSILKNIEVYKCNYKNCRFLQSSLNRAEFQETHFDQSHFLSCFFRGASIQNSSIRDTKFEETCTAGSFFSDSQFAKGKSSINVTGYFDLEGLLKFMSIPSI